MSSINCLLKKRLSHRVIISPQKYIQYSLCQNHLSFFCIIIITEWTVCKSGYYDTVQNNILTSHSDDYSTLLNWSFPTPHIGHTQSSGKSSNRVPGAIPPSGSPTSGSYTQSHTSQTYFSITLNFGQKIYSILNITVLSLPTSPLRQSWLLHCEAHQHPSA